MGGGRTCNDEVLPWLISEAVSFRGLGWVVLCVRMCVRDDADGFVIARVLVVLCVCVCVVLMW